MREAAVRLSVFDLSGRAVSTLLRSTLKPGDYSLAWNGRDDAGRRLAQGVYFLRLDAEGERQTVKTLLVQ